MTTDPKKLPIEVSLVQDVKTCRTCKWFWGDIPPYGPYPAFDVKQDYPEAMIDKEPQSPNDNKPRKWLSAQSNGLQFIDPAVMHGCRKAPIMTIGINPNLTAYYSSTSGTRWVYPSFSRPQDYAYYYRHKTIYQESIDLIQVAKWLQDEDKIVAEENGWVADIQRSSDHRWLVLSVQYQNKDAITQYELSWGTRLHGVVLYDKDYRYLKEKERAPFTFNKGAVLAGKISAEKDVTLDVYKNGTKYYQRMIPILQAFKRNIGGALANADLRIGEDVAQHDMIHCASPGWSDSYDIPTDQITFNCVKKQGFVVSQMLQAMPSVIIIVGGSSLKMLGEVFSKYIDLDWNNRDIYQLLKQTTEKQYYLNINEGGAKFKARLIAVPHFSYDDNYKEHARLSPEAWQAFQKDFRQDYKILDELKLIKIDKNTGAAVVKLSGSEDPIQNDISVEGWQVLTAYFLDANAMVAKALEQEYQAGTLSFDPTTGHLTRSEGACRFCVNDLWSFPEGCPYGKIPVTSQIDTEKTVLNILKNKQREFYVKLTTTDLD